MLTKEKFEKKKELAHLLSECVLACNHCFSACLEEEDVKMMRECIRNDKECAEVCAFTIGMLHKSRFVNDYLKLCIQVCENCAEECEKFPHAHCKQCAEACRRCAETCRDFMQSFIKN